LNSHFPLKKPRVALGPYGMLIAFKQLVTVLDPICVWGVFFMKNKVLFTLGIFLISWLVSEAKAENNTPSVRRYERAYFEGSIDYTITRPYIRSFLGGKPGGGASSEAKLTVTDYVIRGGNPLSFPKTATVEVISPLEGDNYPPHRHPDIKVMGDHINIVNYGHPVSHNLPSGNGKMVSKPVIRKLQDARTDQPTTTYWFADGTKQTFPDKSLMNW